MVDPALMLGAAVVKIACKVWLKDNAIAADAAVSVADIIQSHVTETRERRRVQRMFEDLEERVADNVLRNMGTEFRALAQNERDAAVLAVSDTLAKAKLTAPDLFATDLDASRLLKAVRPVGRRFARDLDEPATELYERVLRDCCAYVVEIADTLPGFHVGVFGELLARQKEIIRHVDERFDRLPMQLGGAGAATFEPTYLRLVANQLDKVELFGVSDRIQDYPLSVAYVSLSIAAKARFEDAALDARPEQRVGSIEEGLGGTRRAFIRGEAGSGKTTLLQWLAVRCARNEFDGPLQEWNGSVPLLIRLRRYSGKELPRPEEFLRDVGGPIAHTMPMEWMHDLLRSGRALLLVDGVDELPEKQRRRAREWLRELLLAYPEARYVITSRPAAAAENWLEDEYFDALEIQPMTLADLDAFVDHWHAAMADGARTSAERERIELSRVELTRTIRTHRHLRMLAVSPLMTALICALHLDRRMQLPNDRMELYSIALEMLLERRDTEREIDSAVAITRVDKMLLLEDLAYWLVRNGLSSAPKERVLERLTAKLANLHRVKSTADEVLKHLLDRSGLLREPVDGQVDFVHKTFQEFLAGRAAVAADDIGALVRNAHDDQWREVVLMAIGQARATQTDELVRKLLGRAHKEREHRYVLEALAVGCIQHAPQLSPDLQKRMQEVTSDLLPPKGVKQAVALAAVGDLALELLSTRTDYTMPEAIATIRMAATIGGEQALPVIAELVQSKQLRFVRDEVERAWSKFDPELFAREVLARTDQRYMRLTDPSQLAGLRHLPNVWNLTCRFPHGYGNVAYIADLLAVDHFDVDDPKLRSIDPVAGHPSLTSIDLKGHPSGVELSPLARVENLDEVNFYVGQIPRDQLRFLSRIRRLGIIDVVDLDEVLPFLAEGVPLTRLDVWSFRGTGLTTLAASSRMEELDFLLLGQADQLISLAGIDRWADTMTGVYLRASAVVDLGPLASLKLLEFANLTRVPIRSLGFTRDMFALRDLYIGKQGLGLPDLTPLSDLPRLRNLHIRGDRPVDLSGLAGASDLKVHVAGKARRISGEDRLPDSVKVVREG